MRRQALRFIVCLGIVSLFADMTYEGAYSIIGPFLKDLGATAGQVGFIAGLGQMIAAGLRFFSGRLADRTRAYWGITILGYCLNLVVVPALAFAGNWQTAALLIVAERAGKSLRGPARDVLLSEATVMVGHGWGFGLHTALDQTGAVIGPLFVALAVARTQHFAPAFLRLAIPAVCAITALMVARFLFPAAGRASATEVRRQDLPRVFWLYVAAAAVLAFGFIDFPLLAFHFQNTGLFAAPVIPLLYAGAMGINGLAALLLGRLFDRYGVAVLSFGAAISVLSLPLGFLGGPTAAMAGIACWAIGLGAQDACLRAGIAQVVSMNRRGTAFGAFNGIFGVAWFLGSVMMGQLYSVSLTALVGLGAIAELIAAVLFWRLRNSLATAVPGA